MNSNKVEVYFPEGGERVYDGQVIASGEESHLDKDTLYEILVDSITSGEQVEVFFSHRYPDLQEIYMEVRDDLEEEGVSMEKVSII